MKDEADIQITINQEFILHPSHFILLNILHADATCRRSGRGTAKSGGWWLFRRASNRDGRSCRATSRLQSARGQKSWRLHTSGADSGRKPAGRRERWRELRAIPAGNEGIAGGEE